MGENDLLSNIVRGNKNRSDGFYSFKPVADGSKHECDLQGPYSFASTTKTGELIRYSTMPEHNVAAYLVDVCYSKRNRDNIRTAYCSIPDDIHQIASLVEYGIPFRKARSKVGYSGRIKCLDVPKYAGSYFSNPDDIPEMSELLHDGVGLVEALEMRGFVKFRGENILHGNIMQLLCKMPQYDVVITPTLSETHHEIKNMGDIYVRPTDGTKLDDAGDYRLGCILDKLMHKSGFFIESIDSFNESE